MIMDSLVYSYLYEFKVIPLDKCWYSSFARIPIHVISLVLSRN